MSDVLGSVASDGRDPIRSVRPEPGVGPGVIPKIFPTRDPDLHRRRIRPPILDSGQNGVRTTH